MSLVSGVTSSHVLVPGAGSTDANADAANASSASAKKNINRGRWNKDEVSGPGPGPWGSGLLEEEPKSVGQGYGEVTRPVGA